MEAATTDALCLWYPPEVNMTEREGDKKRDTMNN